jgi:hypothetical protein
MLASEIGIFPKTHSTINLERYFCYMEHLFSICALMELVGLVFCGFGAWFWRTTAGIGEEGSVASLRGRIPHVEHQ